MSRLILALVGLTGLAACSERDIILDGQRFDLRPSAAVVNRALPISLPAPQVNTAWTHRGGDADHAIVQPVLATTLSPVFQVSIGEGDSRNARITADPVVAGGIVYTLDARARVTATTTGGAPVWAADVSRRLEGASDASGGGLAVGGGRLYVTTGFGELTALDASSGAVLWVQDLDAPGGASPTVDGDLVYLVSRDGTAWALDAGTGRIRWQLSGTPSTAGFDGGSGAAVTEGLVVFPMPSGEILAAFPQGGLRRWSSVVSGGQPGQVVSRVSDISADPVILDNRVYVGNLAGSVVALDASNGDRMWTAIIGATSQLAVAGNSVFAVSTAGDLVRLDRATGETIWQADLPSATDDRGVIAHYGPLLAGNRLIVAGSDGVIRGFDPVSGALVSRTDLPNGAATHPVVANGVLYIVDKAGVLTAFR